MATFSPKKLDFTNGLEDISYRLVHLHKKILTQLGQQEIRNHKNISLQSILDFIYDIQTAFDELTDLQ